MIETRRRSISVPPVRSLFSTVDRYGGISLFSAQTGEDREYTGINPVIILTEKELIRGNTAERVTDPLAILDRLVKEFSGLPDEISLLGYMSYDFKDRLEEPGLYERRRQGIYPDFYFSLYEHYLISSREQEEGGIITLTFPFPHDSIPQEELLSSLDENPAFFSGGSTQYGGTSHTREYHCKAVEKTIDHIKEGDIYQANITRAVYGRTDQSVLEMAMNLYGSNRITYGVFAALEEGHIISTSPELFFRTGERKILASPIKGTVPRNENPEIDDKSREELLHSEKNIAELAMIVDLLRNDLSRVCRPGTVQVPRFPVLMTLENVYHLYADVKGELLPGTGIGEILRKTFPGGSITGCPKIRACQIIDELEKVPRGIYTGSFGKIGFNGEAVFNIMIRSLFRSGSSIIFNVGGGITLLSDPEEEFEETIHKGANIWKGLNMAGTEEERSSTGEN